MSFFLFLILNLVLILGCVHFKIICFFYFIIRFVFFCLLLCYIILFFYFLWWALGPCSFEGLNPGPIQSKLGPIKQQPPGPNHRGPSLVCLQPASCMAPLQSLAAHLHAWLMHDVLAAHLQASFGLAITHVQAGSRNPHVLTPRSTQSHTYAPMQAGHHVFDQLHMPPLSLCKRD